MPSIIKTSRQIIAIVSEYVTVMLKCILYQLHITTLHSICHCSKCKDKSRYHLLVIFFYNNVAALYDNVITVYIA
jgi:hypothetical protein